MTSSLPDTSGGTAISASFSVGEAIGTADRRLFGSFVEHLGRSVYGGIFDPGDPHADENGFRRDVLDLVRELGVTVVRYPGGNFVSGYDWRDGIGPRDERPRRLDLAWKSIETNQFGTDEFAAWCRAAGVEPMLAVNLGLADARSALDLLEYCNFPSGTATADERVANGSAEPHNIRLWCLGNELDGPWQLGHRDATAYAESAAVTASAMRMFDETLELVAVGSSHPTMPTFGAWEEAVLERTIELVDYLSCHIYFAENEDLPGFLRSSQVLARFLTDVQAIIQRVAARHPDARDVRISLDEWNVWDSKNYGEERSTRDFAVAPTLLEQDYTVADAVVVGSLMQTILAHADIVGVAALAQLVNVIGPIHAEPGSPAWRQTIFFPFAAAARSAGHTVLRTTSARPGEEQPVNVTVTRSGGNDVIQVLLTNTSTEHPAAIDIDLRALGAAAVTSANLLWDADPHAGNTSADPLRIAPQPLAAELVDGQLRATLPPVAWADIVLTTARG